jgi:type II secretory pathway component PulF
LRTFVLAVLCLAALHAVLMYLVPHFERIFADFKVGLPLPTRLLIAVSLAYRQSNWWIWFQIGALFGCVGAVLGNPRAKKMSRGQARVAVLAAGLLVGYVVLSLLLPMLNLMAGVSR